MSHIVVFQAFYTLDHIRQSFESMQTEGVDYYVLENLSPYSDSIRDYFMTKNLKGYIQFEENIGSNAMNIFLRDKWDILKGYDLITITEGDLYIYNIRSLIEEVRMGLTMPNVKVSAAGLYYGNTPDSGTSRQIGLDYYLNQQVSAANNPLGNGYGGGGVHFLTFTRDTIDCIRGTYFNDWAIYEAVNRAGRGVHTNRNKAYHLTWDLLNLQPESEYGAFRRDIDDILGHGGVFKTTKESTYKQLI